MIKIIKEGKVTKFTTTCPDCGCVFEYDSSDIQTDYSVLLTTYPGKYNTYVICPCCEKHIHHGTTFAEDLSRTPIGTRFYYNTDTLNSLYDCDKCPNKPDQLHPVVGDTPCTWCRKNQPYCKN